MEKHDTEAEGKTVVRLRKPDIAEYHRLKSLFAQVEDELEGATELLREIESILSINSEDRELIAQSNVVINSVIRTCRRLKQNEPVWYTNSGQDE